MNLRHEIRSVSRLSGTFTLRSGAQSDVYFDKYQFESRPHLLRASVAICVIDRQAAAEERLLAAGVPLISLFTMDDIENAA